jgi:uncharacterized protein
MIYRPVSFRVAAGLFCVITFFVGLFNACAGEESEFTELSIVKSDNSKISLKVEIADTDEERQLGLMHRKQLPDGHGMLFVFPADQMMSFWMKNTLIPLSIAYIASDGRILEMHDMRPQSLQPVRSARSARYALEVPAGWFVKNAILPGDSLELPRDLVSEAR